MTLEAFSFNLMHHDLRAIFYAREFAFPQASDGDLAESRSGSGHMIQPVKGKANKIESELEVC